MSHSNSNIQSLLNADARALKGILNVIEFLGVEKFMEIYNGKDSDSKKEVNDFDSYADSLLEKINNFR